jgi:hypothetical protein
MTRDVSEYGRLLRRAAVLQSGMADQHGRARARLALLVVDLDAAVKMAAEGDVRALHKIRAVLETMNSVRSELREILSRMAEAFQ